MSRAQRILAMATERGPLGLRQHDFDYPARDHGPAIDSIGQVIARERLGLELYHTVDGPVWYLPEFAPAEYFRTGWRCIDDACGGRHLGAWFEVNGPVCGHCGGDGIFQVRVVVRPRDTTPLAHA